MGHARHDADIRGKPQKKQLNETRVCPVLDSDGLNAYSSIQRPRLENRPRVQTTNNEIAPRDSTPQASSLVAIRRLRLAVPGVMIPVSELSTTCCFVSSKPFAAFSKSSISLVQQYLRWGVKESEWEREKCYEGSRETTASE